MKKTCKFLMLVLSLSMCLNSFAYATTSDDSAKVKELQGRIDSLQDQIRDKNYTIDNLREQLENQDNSTPEPKNPLLMVVEPLSISVPAGTTKEVEITIKNLTSDSAKNVLTTVKSAEKGIVASFSKADNFKYSLGNKSSYKTTLSVSVDSTVKPGLYSVDFSHAFVNETNEKKESNSVIQIKVEGTGNASNAVIEDIKTSPAQILAGTDFTLNAFVESRGTENITDVQVTLEGLKSEEIFIKDSTNILSFTSMTRGIREEISIPLTSNKKIKQGSYPITLKLSYKDSAGEKQTKDYVYYISISDGSASSGQSSEVYISNITAPAEAKGVGVNFDMVVTVSNTSTQTAKNIKISAKPEGEGAVVPKSTSVMQINSLGPNETKDLKFTFAATEASKSQNYVIGFTLEYETGKLKDDDTKEILSFTQYQGVNVSNPKGDKKEDEKDKTSTPKIIIKEYASDPVIVQAGQEFDLSMTFLNTNTEKPIKNIKAYLTIDEGTEKKGSVFTPVRSSNTFYIDKMEPKGEIAKNFRFYTIPDASPKTYTINVNFEYEDMENNEYKSTEIVGISVKQITKLDVSEYTVDSFASLYNPIYLNFEMYNTGKVTLSNLMITVEGNFEANQKSTYYGTFSASSTEYYDNMITPIEPGTQELKIIISYEDDSGKPLSIERSFTIEVADAMPMDNNISMDMFDPETGFPMDEKGNIIDPETGKPLKKGGSMGIYIAIGAVVVLTAGGIIFYRIKKKKESFDLDE